jgi:site-specific recombinase XerC
LRAASEARGQKLRTNDLPTLQNILGHASSRMTQRYAHLSKGHLASEMQVFAAAMPRSGAPRRPRRGRPYRLR